MTVDHIRPRAERPDLALSPANLQTLCDTCHGQAKQAHERNAHDPLAGGTSATGWPVDPRHPWNGGAGRAAPAKSPARVPVSASGAPARRGQGTLRPPAWPIHHAGPQTAPAAKIPTFTNDEDQTP
jgi:hypothetical protein